MACEYPQYFNPMTGRCRKPCSRHQAINPLTGRCVTKTYLQTLQLSGLVSPEDYLEDLSSFSSRAISPYGNLGFSYTDKSTTPRGVYPRRFYYNKDREDRRDMLVNDSACYPRKRNLLTGMCKKPCPPGKMINPFSGNCVYEENMPRVRRNRRIKLKTLYRRINDYDTDEDDKAASDIVLTPSDTKLKEIHTNKEMRTLIENSELTVADLKILRGFMVGLNHDNTERALGIFSSKNRKQCDQSTLQSLFKTPEQKCGFSDIKEFEDDKDMFDRIKKARFDFVLDGARKSFKQLFQEENILGEYIEFFNKNKGSTDDKIGSGQYRVAVVFKKGVIRMCLRFDSTADKPFSDLPKSSLLQYDKTFEDVKKEDEKEKKEEQEEKDKESKPRINKVLLSINHAYVNKIAFSYHEFNELTEKDKNDSE